MRILTHIRDAQGEINIYEPWHVQFLTRDDEASRTFTLLWARLSTLTHNLIYSPYGHGLREYEHNKEYWCEELAHFLPVYQYSGFAKDKLDDRMWNMTNGVLRPTAFLPQHMWR